MSAIEVAAQPGLHYKETDEVLERLANEGFCEEKIGLSSKSPRRGIRAPVSWRGQEVCVKNVCVYCGSRKGNDPAWELAARELGREMASRGMGLVFGGGAVGLMGVIADEILGAGGEVVGVIPWGLSSTEVTNEAVTELIHCDTMHERKALMEKRSDGFIAMPGGYGTLDELFEILTWSQLGLHRKPVGVFNTGGFFDHLLTYLDETTERGFISRAHRDIIKASADPVEMLDAMEAYEPEHGAIWSVEP